MEGSSRYLEDSGRKKYTDLIAVIDPYHELPTGWTYTQLEQEILDFSQV